MQTLRIVLRLACARLSDSIRSGNILKAKLRRARLGKGGGGGGKNGRESLLGMGRTMANLLKCPEFLRTCLTPKMSETSLRYRV